MIVPFETLQGALAYLSAGSKVGWTIEVQAGIYVETLTMSISGNNTGVTIHLSAGVSIQSDPTLGTKNMFQIEGNASCTILGDGIDGEYNQTVLSGTGNGPLGGASIVSNGQGQVMFGLLGNATVQQLNISNVAMIHASATSPAPMIYYELGTANQERHLLNITNCYIRQDSTGQAGLVIATSSDYPKRTIIDIRDTWITTKRVNGVTMDFTTMNSNTDVLALKLRDNMFYSTTGGDYNSTVGFIQTRAVQGAQFYWYWQGNTFYSGGILSIGTNVKLYAWYDSSASTNACRLIQTTPSIHNYDTFNSPPIINMTPVTMYGPLKITEPEWWNRS